MRGEEGAGRGAKTARHRNRPRGDRGLASRAAACLGTGGNRRVCGQTRGHYERPRSRSRGSLTPALGQEAAETVKRGDVFWADLAPRSGSEQTGRRPVIIVSHDGFNATPGWRSVIVVPLSTSAKRAQRGPTAALRLAGAAWRRKRRA